MASKKQLSQSELRGVANDLISVLAQPGQVLESVESLVEETASIRKDALEIFLLRVREQKQSFNAKPVVSLLGRFMLTGTPPKADFIVKYYRVVFDCALNTAGEEGALACRELILILLRQFAKSESEAAGRIVSSSIFSILADSKGLVRGLDALLSDSSMWDVLNETFDVWSVVIPELVSKGLSSFGLSEAAASGFLNVVGRHRGPLGSALKLALPYVTRVVSSLPAEFCDSPHAGLTKTLANQVTEAEDKGSSSIATATSHQNQFGNTNGVQYLPEIVQLGQDMLAILGKLNLSVEDRLQNLSKVIEQSKADVSSARRDLDEKERSIASLIIREKRLQEKVSELKHSLAAKDLELGNTQDRLAQYSESHDAIAGSLETREQDVISRVKREFAEQEKSILVDIRHYIDVLKSKPTVETALLAASCFNRLVRFLHKQHYFTANELAQIEVIDHGEGA